MGTLVGVINNSSEPVYTLSLGSPLQAFYFTLNGIVNHGVQGNALDKTGYGGPNAYFSDIGAARQSGLCVGNQPSTAQSFLRH